MYEFRIINKSDYCGICMMKMNKAVKLYCGHYYHAYCVMQLLASKKKHCPICKASFDKYYGSYSETTSVFDSILHGVINPVWTRQNVISEENIERLQRMFPSISRTDIINEITEAGNVEQAIVNISEWV